MNSLPLVVLIGDSIRMGYQDYVVSQLSGRAEVWVPEEKEKTKERRTMNNLRGWAIVVMCVSLLWGCSNEHTREQLVLDVERLVLEHERFVQDLERYHQERERLEERTVGLVTGVFLSTWLTDGAADLTGEAEQIAEDAKQFAPEAERLYQEGERLAWELRRAYEKRDWFVPEAERLTQERNRLAQELDQVYQTVDLIEQEILQTTQAFIDATQAFIDATQAYDLWKRENQHLEQTYREAEKDYDEAKKAENRALKSYKSSDMVFGNMFDSKITMEDYYAYIRAGKVRERAYEVYRQASDAYLQDPSLIAFEQAGQTHTQASETYDRTCKRLEEDLERAYLNWNWLDPYLDRLVRDMGLRVRVD